MNSCTHSKIREGFHDGASVRDIPVAWVACADGIMTSDCTAGESPLLSPGPAETGGEMGWLLKLTCVSNWWSNDPVRSRPGCLYPVVSTRGGLE